MGTGREIVHKGADATEILIHEGEPKYETVAELTIVINLAWIFANVRGAGRNQDHPPP
jgi:hypothetical protein